MFHELQAKSKTELHIRLFGAVGQWELINANYIAKLLNQAKADGYDKVKFLLHCPGGSIFEGIPVNTIVRNAGIETDIEVHGVACSWGAVLLQSADKRGMVQGTRLMIHQGHGGVSGSAAQIINYGNLLGTLNVDVAAILADRTGKDKEWVLENWMAEGMDKWFTAEEALEAGLIDYIIPNTKQKDKAAAYNSMEELAAFFDESLLATNYRKMDKEQLAKSLGLDAKASEKEINAAIEALKVKAEKAEAGDGKAEGSTTEPPKPAGDGNAATATADEKQIDAFMKMAEKSGLVNDKNKESIRKIATADLSAALDLLPEGGAAAPKAHQSIAELVAEIKKGGTPPEKAKAWDDYSAEEKAKMEEENPTEFKALFEKTFNKKLK